MGDSPDSPKGKVVLVGVKVSVEDLLENKLPSPLDLDSFREYCQYARCEENLDFMLKSAEYDKIDNDASARVFFTNLYKEFIDSNSSKMINLSHKEFKMFQEVKVSIESATMEQIRKCFIAARFTINLLLEMEIVPKYLQRITIKKQLVLSKEIAAWWLHPPTLRQFFTFPDPINDLEAQFHSILNCSWIIINALLYYFYGWNTLCYYLVYGFFVRVLAGPRLDPQAFLILFILRPLVEDWLRLTESNFVPSFPRRVAQSVGFVFSATATTLQLLDYKIPSLAVWGVLLVFASLVAFFRFCLVCFIYHTCFERSSSVSYVSKNQVHSKSGNASGQTSKSNITGGSSVQLV